MYENVSPCQSGLHSWLLAHEVAGLSPALVECLSEPKRHFIAQRPSYSCFCLAEEGSVDWISQTHP